MAKVKFNMDIVDSDSQIRYSASEEFVEVSENFATRLRKAGVDVIFEGEETNSEAISFSKEEILAECEKHIQGIEEAHAEKVKALEEEILALKALLPNGEAKAPEPEAPKVEEKPKK